MSDLITLNTLDRRAPSAADFSKNHVNTPNGELSKIISTIPAGMALEKISVTCSLHGKATWFITSKDLAAGKTGCQKCRWEIETSEQKKATERQAMLGSLNMPVEHIGAGFSNWQAVGGGDKQLATRIQNIVNFGQNYAATYQRGHANILLTGNTGTGKTKLACLIANEIIRCNYTPRMTVIFKTSAEIQNESKAYWRDKTVESDVDYLARLGRATVLIIDEVGEGDTGFSDKAADDDRERLSRLIDKRYKDGLPTIITTNLPPNDFYAHVGHRAADRLRQNMVEIVCNWKSYRYATGRVMSL